MNERLDAALSWAKARESGSAIVMHEKDVIDFCTKCKKPIHHIGDVGYMGPVDRDNQECSPLISFEVLCSECEGSSVL